MAEDVEKKLRELELRRVEKRRKKIKDEDLFEVVEEVFDRATVLALCDLINDGVIDQIFGAVAAGKEARIYWAKSPKGEDLAVKIYLVQTAEFRRGMIRYIEGDPRFQRVRRSRRHLIRLWCSKEFRNLRAAYEAGVKVPKPIAFKENILVMSFIGENGVPAPLIKDEPPEDPDQALKTILTYIERAFTKGQIVHADLSEYNIVNWNGDLYIIDWGSAVHKSHPNALEFLLRDIKNVIRFFERLGAEAPDPEEFFKKLVSEQT